MGMRPQIAQPRGSRAEMSGGKLALLTLFETGVLSFPRTLFLFVLKLVSVGFLIDGNRNRLNQLPAIFLAHERSVLATESSSEHFECLS